MDDFKYLIKRDPEVQIKIKDILDKHDYQSKIGYDTSIQNVIHTEKLNLVSTVIVDIDVELKLKIILKMNWINKIE